MIMTIELPEADEAAWNAEAAQLGLGLEGLSDQAMRSLIAMLKNQRVPQSLDEIKPRRLPPLGKTAMQMVHQQLPADESDEELQVALRTMD